MTIIKRKRNDQFAIIPNAVANDDRLSFEARGLLVYLLAKPHDWEIRRSDLQRAGGIGRDKAQKLMRELIGSGYMERGEDRRDTDGRILGPQYIVSNFPIQTTLPLSQPEPENAVLDGPGPDLPAPVKPEPENTAPYKEQRKQNTESPLPPKGEWEEDFDILWSRWPEGQRPDNRKHAEGLFKRLSPDERAQALSALDSYSTAMIRRSKPRRMVTYLKERQFIDFFDAPDLDNDGHFRITPKRPEWGPWLGAIRKKYGEDAVQRTVMRGFYLPETRWPPSDVASA